MSARLRSCMVTDSAALEQMAGQSSSIVGQAAAARPRLRDSCLKTQKSAGPFADPLPHLLLGERRLSRSGSLSSVLPLEERLLLQQARSGSFPAVEDDDLTLGEMFLHLVRTRTLGDEALCALAPRQPLPLPGQLGEEEQQQQRECRRTESSRRREQVVQYVLPHIVPPPAFSTQPSRYVFCLDVSGSMGHFSHWAPGNCSRLSLALTYLACYIQRSLAPHDQLLVLGFAQECRPILEWRQRGAGFDRDAFLDDCKAGICNFRRSGTQLFTAFAEACHMLQQRVASQAPVAPQGACLARCLPGRISAWWPGAADDGRQGLGSLGGASPAPGGPEPTNAVVLLTDGEACDPQAFAAAHALTCSPEMDFKAFMMRIDTSRDTWCRDTWRNTPQLSALAHFPDGRPIPYVQYSELELPPVVDMDDDPTSRSAMETMSQAFNSFSMIPSAFSTGENSNVGCQSVQPRLLEGGHASEQLS